MMHGWQSDPTDGQKSGIGVVAPQPQLLDVASCSADVVVTVVYCSGIVVALYCN